MSKEFIYKDERDWPNPRLTLGAIVGHTTTTTSRLWVRTGKPGDYTLIYYKRPAKGSSGDLIKGFGSIPYDIERLPSSVKKSFHVTDFAKDTTEVIDLENLEPNSEYCYALYGLDVISNKKRILLGQNRAHTFKTMPEEEVPYSFALYSCHMPYKDGRCDTVEISENKHMWAHFEETLKRHKNKSRDLCFVIGGGDQIYADGIDTEKINIINRLNNEVRKKGATLYPTKKDMVLWYRDLYRGYWGFGEVKKVFSSFPTYMIWDDHEIWDGWGSYILKPGRKDELDKMFPIYGDKKKMREKGLTREDLLIIKKRMFEAAKQVYNEYQHSHNPKTRHGRFDYSFSLCRSSAFYFLDGRGNRDVNRESLYILGSEQLERFEGWLEALDPEETKVVFVLSTVPVIHMATLMANMADSWVAKKFGLNDDLRDSWENKRHDKERKRLMGALFKAADRGQKVVILSGDVHLAAAFKVTNGKSIIHQLTSSAITYNLPLWQSYFFAKFGVADDGTTREGYKFKRLALYGESNYSVVKVDPNGGKPRIVFQLYGEQEARAPRDLPKYSTREKVKKEEGIFRESYAMTHSIAKIPLDFDNF